MVGNNENEKDMISCVIAELCVQISTAGDMYSRCREYVCRESSKIDIYIDKNDYILSRWGSCENNLAIYLESGFQFYRYLLLHNGMMLHSSAVELDNKAYLFSGPCGAGKSTHTKMWKNIFGESAQIFNDDKPALRRMEDKWYTYGTPWCGKDGINQNKKIPLVGICFLKKGLSNSIRRLDAQEAISKVLSQTINKFYKIENLDKVLHLVDQLVREIPIYELTNRPEPEAAILSYETMRKGAEEAGL